MSSGVVTLQTDASCHDAVTLMVRNKIRHLPVVDRDLRHRLFQPDVFHAIGRVPVERLLSDVSVREVMSSPVVSIGGDAGVDEAARLMRDKKLGSLPVVEHD